MALAYLPVCLQRLRSPTPQRLNNRSNRSPGIESVWSNTSTPLSKSSEDARQSATGAGSSTFGATSPRAVAGGFSVGSKSTNTPSGKSAVIRHTRRGMVAFFTFTEMFASCYHDIAPGERHTRRQYPYFRHAIARPPTRRCHELNRLTDRRPIALKAAGAS